MNCSSSAPAPRAEDIKRRPGDLGEQPRCPGQCGFQPHHRAGCPLAALASPMPVLKAQPVNAGHVPRGPHGRVAGPVLGVGQDPVVDRDAGIPREIGARHHSHPDDREGRVQPFLADPGRAGLECCHPRREPDLDAGLLETVAAPCGHAVAELTGPQRVGLLDQNRPEPEGGQRGRHLHADEAAAHHDRPRTGRRGRRGPEPMRVGQRPHQEPGLRPGDRRHDRLGTGREKAALERDRRSVAQRRAAGPGIEHRHARPGPESRSGVARTRSRARPPGGLRRRRRAGTPWSAAAGYRARASRPRRSGRTRRSPRDAGCGRSAPRRRRPRPGARRQPRVTPSGHPSRAGVPDDFDRLAADEPSRRTVTARRHRCRPARHRRPAPGGGMDRARVGAAPRGRRAPRPIRGGRGPG